MCGTPSRSARRPASVVFPEQHDPITAIFRSMGVYGSGVLRPARRAPRSRRLPRLRGGGRRRPRVNWVAPFVKQTGCKVHVRTVRSSTELLDAVAHGRYDGVAAFGDVTQVLTGGHEVLPIDTARIPNYARVYPALRRLPQNVEDGRVVGIP